MTGDGTGSRGHRMMLWEMGAIARLMTCCTAMPAASSGPIVNCEAPRYTFSTKSPGQCRGLSWLESGEISISPQPGYPS